MGSCSKKAELSFRSSQWTGSILSAGSKILDWQLWSACITSGILWLIVLNRSTVGWYEDTFGQCNTQAFWPERLYKHAECCCALICV